MSAPATKIPGGGYGSEEVTGTPYSGGSDLPVPKIGGNALGPKTVGGRRRRRSAKRSKSRRSRSSSRRRRR